jgi:acetone carboxylase gamma subunit
MSQAHVPSTTTAPAPQAVGDAFTVVDGEDGRELECSRCRHPFGAATEDPKLSAVVAERDITWTSELNAYGLVDELVLREFYCPGCGAMIAANVQRIGDPIMREMRLA